MICIEGLRRDVNDVLIGHHALAIELNENLGQVG